MFRFIVLFRLVIIVVLLPGCSGKSTEELSVLEADELLVETRRAIESGDYPKAEKNLARLMAAGRETVESLTLAGQAARQQGQFDQSIEKFTAAIEFEDSATAIPRCLLADTLMYDKGEAARAEQIFREVLKDEPHNSMALQGMGMMMQVQGRVWESTQYLLGAVRFGRSNARNLIVLGWTQRSPQNSTTLELCLKTDPKDPHASLGMARIAVQKNKPEVAVEHLARCLDQNQYQCEALGLLGTLLLELNRDDEFAVRFGQLSQEQKESPDVLFALGMWSQKHGQPDAAIRMFTECFRRNPDHPRVSYQLSRRLVAAGRPDAARPYADRARKLEKLGLILGLIHDANSHSELSWLRDAADLTESLGRLIESECWNRLVLLLDPQNVESAKATLRVQAKLRQEMDSEVEAACRTARSTLDRFDLNVDEFPFPVVAGHEKSRGRKRLSSGEFGPVHLADATVNVAIDFSYFPAPDAESDGVHMYEQTGGGVAAFDFDGDRWPDLYFSQGCRWPFSPGTNEFLDALFRNIDGERFVSAHAQAEVFENGFGQGVSAGDFDNDGFADLYVANIGQNRLFRNCGDGTFEDVTAAAGITANDWTTSCAIADVNGDGNPDVYDVNYVTGDDVFDRVCKGRGLNHACRPALFEPAKDRLLVNTGNSEFDDITESSGIVAPGGRGLGIVIANMAGAIESGPDIFIANDFVPNFFFENRAELPAGVPRFSENGALSGLAFDANGRYQACMGVAADDANGDGRLDIFVTNFSDESNTLYQQSQDGVFGDRTNFAGLRAPGFDLIGWGTQFLDGDLDGDRDLMICNGALADNMPPENGMPARMLAQYFTNQDGRFVIQPPAETGSYFEKPQLGRALALLDWNRDGREEAVVTHIGSAATLLRNDTVRSGRSLAVTLRGTRSSRDAIGAIVEVTTSDRTVTRHLTGGSGFMASNERKLIFGIADARSITKLTVTWPSGAVSQFTDVEQPDVCVVEGSARIW